MVFVLVFVFLSLPVHVRRPADATVDQGDPYLMVVDSNACDRDERISDVAVGGQCADRVHGWR